MSKKIGETVESIAKSALWAAASRIGVPLILALVLTGIPAHLLWASRVNEEQAIFRRDLNAVVLDVRELKDGKREDARNESIIKSDISAVKTDIAAILRALTRMERQIDTSNERR